MGVRRFFCSQTADPVLPTPIPPHSDTPIRRRAARIVLLLIALAASLALTSCSTTDAVSGEGVYNLYSMEGEVQMGRQAMQQNLAQIERQGVRINADYPRYQQIRGVVQRIAAVSDMPQLPYEIVLIHNGEVNAAALPGGQMMVFDGLYHPQKGLVQDENEMAAVIAHEIAHVNCRHSTERISKVMTAAALAEVAAAVAEHNDESDWATGIRAAFAVGAVLYLPTYTRGDEAEADRVGLFYMAKAGYDPRAAARIWKRAVDQEKAGGSGTFILGFLADHPSNESRYRELSKLLPYAMEEYARAAGGYPAGYDPASLGAPLGPEYNWRRPEKR